MTDEEYAQRLAQRALTLAKKKARVVPGFDPKRNLERAVHDTLGLVQGIERNMRNSAEALAIRDLEGLKTIAGDVTQAYELSRTAVEQLIEIGLELARRKREEEAEPESVAHEFGVRLASLPGGGGVHCYATAFVRLVRTYEHDITHRLTRKEAAELNGRDGAVGAYNKAGDVSRRFFSPKEAAVAGARYLMDTYDAPLHAIGIECDGVLMDDVVGWTVLASDGEGFPRWRGEQVMVVDTSGDANENDG